MPSSAPPRENFAYEVRGTFRALENALITYLGEKKVPVAHFHVLRLPWSEDGMPQKHIANLSFMTPSAASQLIQKMSQQGLLERGDDAKDARKIQVFLTKKGWELRDTILEGALDIPQKACEDIPDEDIHTAIRVLTSARRQLEAK